MSTTPDMARVGEIVRRHLPSRAYEAFLFGSRARGNAAERSDWDIGILGPAPVRGAVIQQILGELEELPTLHRFEVVDLQTVPEDFRRRALEHRVLL